MVIILSLGLFEQRPNFGLPFFQFRNILSIEMPGAVDAAANLVDIPGSPADGCGQFLLLGVIHLDDVAVNRHFSEICAHVPGAELRHFALDEPPLLLGDAETRCGSVLCVQPLDIRLLKLQRTIFADLGGTLEKISPFIFQRTVSGKNLVPAQKKFLSHFTTDILFAD